MGNDEFTKIQANGWSSLQNYFYSIARLKLLKKMKPTSLRTPWCCCLFVILKVRIDAFKKELENSYKIGTISDAICAICSLEVAMLVLEELQLLWLMARYFGAEMPELTLTATSTKNQKNNSSFSDKKWHFNFTDIMCTPHSEIYGIFISD